MRTENHKIENILDRIFHGFEKCKKEMNGRLKCSYDKIMQETKVFSVGYRLF